MERLGQRACAFVTLKDLAQLLSSYTPLPSALSMGFSHGGTFPFRFDTHTDRLQ